ncbi:hypothetical protein NIES2119_22035 [[Phormidium ambiguum] IAM M-71]|uniref:DUF4435 domain-containing protein n=2 Tax=[Phormidium ambiguum] IAM M-71 TaxID=454136 RepID=A0A1U7IBM1_9CYAN|nr:hypothetical protein NIES2119_22035 [Phormidium ambiguum IAM M-71]
MTIYQTPDTIANDIRMRRTNNASMCFLIVEGHVSDAEVYGKFIAEDNCQIIAAHNKENSIQVLEILEKDNFVGVLAIVDSDFDLLKGIKITSKNLFKTDVHDLECMILKSRSLDRFLNCFGSRDKIDSLSKEPILIVLEVGKQIGYLRWTSLEHNLSLKFEDLNFSSFIDYKTLTVNYIKFLQILRTSSNSNKLSKLTNQDVENLVMKLIDPSHDLWHVCCGHDLIEILALGLRKIFGTLNAKELDREKIEKILRLAYDRDLFCETSLYKQIKEWESTNSSFKVFT